MREKMGWMKATRSEACLIGFVCTVYIFPGGFSRPEVHMQPLGSRFILDDNMMYQTDVAF